MSLNETPLSLSLSVCMCVCVYTYTHTHTHTHTHIYICIYTYNVPLGSNFKNLFLKYECSALGWMSACVQEKQASQPGTEENTPWQHCFNFHSLRNVSLLASSPANVPPPRAIYPTMIGRFVQLCTQHCKVTYISNSRAALTLNYHI